MKLFTKIALVAAMAVSANAMAMQSMDDEALSATTGQDGITVEVALGTSGLTIGSVYVHDNDGYNASGIAGAIAINDLTITQQNTANPLATLVIDSDGGTANGALDGAFLNIAAEIDGLDVSIGEINVGRSGTLDTATATRGTEAGSEKAIISGLDLSLGAMGANIQLGSTPQGAMIKLDTTLVGGLDITNFGINDAANGGEIFLDSIYVRGAGNTTGDLDITADINIKPAGLEIVSTGTQGINTYVEGIHLGARTNASIGDMEIQNLNLAGSTITITGH
jgi:hypothetical protein